MDKEVFYCWLAGLIDGDGCFTISLSISRSKNKSICVGNQVRIAVKGNDSEYIDYIHKESNVGKVYWSNKGKPNAICSWQTTNLNDTIEITEKVLPYLVIKKNKAEKFLNVAKYWKDTVRSKKDKKNYSRRRNKEEISNIVKVAISLNFDRQTVRYRDKKGWNYWSKIIDELYDDEI